MTHFGNYKLNISTHSLRVVLKLAVGYCKTFLNTVFAVNIGPFNASGNPGIISNSILKVVSNIY